MRIRRRETLAVAGAVALVAAAFAVPHLRLGVTPLINAPPERFAAFAGMAPIFGWWQPHIGWGTGPALAIGGATALWGPSIAMRMSWRGLTLTTGTVAAAWAFSLAMIDGWEFGFAGRLTARHEYLQQVPTVTNIPEAVHHFTARILDFQPNSWITHVSGHPPGALLTFVWLDRIGLTGGAWAGLLCLLSGSSAAVAIIVTVRALADEHTARRAAPFVAVSPAAIWIAVSADGYFAGVAAWGIALLALAARRSVRMPALASVGAGLLLGWGMFLSYGLALMAIPAAAVVIAGIDRRSALRALMLAATAAVAVVLVFTLAGFWWLHGYELVQQRYWQGIAADRPFQYWWWGNLASVVCAIGLAGVAGMSRAIDISALRERRGLNLLLVAMVVAILLADASQLSKAEVERIWLPFTVWLPASAALLPPRSHRWWLAVNVVAALALNHLVLTNW